MRWSPVVVYGRPKHVSGRQKSVSGRPKCVSGRQRSSVKIALFSFKSFIQKYLATEDTEKTYQKLKIKDKK
jgi:hypothetical protein